MVGCETASLIHNSLSHFGREYIDTFDRQKFYISFEKTHSKINRETFASAYLFICFVSQPLFYLLSAIVFLVCAVSVPDHAPLLGLSGCWQGAIHTHMEQRTFLGEREVTRKLTHL